MLCSDYTINYDNFTEPIKIIPLSDIHYGNAFCDVKSFQKTLKDNPDAYIIGIGDMFDSILPTDKRYQRSSDAFGGMDASLDMAVNEMAQMLMPHKDRIIGLGHGNHENVIIKKCGTNMVDRLCSVLGCNYLGYSGFVGLRFEYKSGDTRGNVKFMDIYYHHGFGGGSRTEGADITKYWRHAKNFEANVFLYGHTHKLLSDSKPHLSRGKNNKLISKGLHLAVCGTYLKTFSNDTDTTYSEVAGYPPVPVGSPIMKVRPLAHGWLDIKIDT